MNLPIGWQAVHRAEDGELVGYLSRAENRGAPGWTARTIFGGALQTFADRESAARHLTAHGLAVLAAKWWYWSVPDNRWILTFLVEARLGAVTVRFGYDPASSVTLRGDDLDRLALAIP